MTWDDRWIASGSPGAPFAWVPPTVERHAPAPPATALDVAGGNGRNSLWLAAAGYDVTNVDASVAGLAAARRAADANGDTLRTVHRDIEADGLPPGTWDVIVIVRYFHREVLRSALKALTEGGVLLFAQPTEMNLERHDRPRRDFLPAVGEIAELVETWSVPDLDIIALDEAWRENDCHEVRLVARRAASAEYMAPPGT